MDFFQEVKSKISAREAAEYYGVTVHRNGMACCPFHQDRTPSMKLDARFHCFGCGADGDAIDFVSRLFGLDTKDAAEKLNRDFGLRLELKASDAPHTRRPESDAQKYVKAEERCLHVLSEYIRLLRKWRKLYAPDEQQKWPEPFVEALRMQSYVEYQMDLLLNGDITERATWIAQHGKDVMKLEGRLSELAAGPEGCSDADRGLNAAGKDGGRDQGKPPADQKGHGSEQH